MFLKEAKETSTTQIGFQQTVNIIYDTQLGTWLLIAYEVWKNYWQFLGMILGLLCFFPSSSYVLEMYGKYIRMKWYEI